MKKENVLGLLVYFSCFILTNSFSQKAPDTDVWVGRINTLDAEKPVFSTPVNITQRKGYDNQPFFSYDNQRLLYSTTIDKQNDIWLYDFVSNSNMHVTKTKESEFSPKETLDKRYISTVRIDLDSVQRLWKYDQLDLTRKLKIDKELDSIGYYTWLTNSTFAWFKITDPPTLWYHDITSKKSKLLTTNIGRTFCLYAADTLLLTQTQNEKKFLVLLSLSKGITTATNVVEMPENGSHDFVIVSINGKKYIWTSVAKTIVSYEIGSQEKVWKTIADFTKYEIKTINRLAISKDQKRYAFASEE